MLQVKIVTRHCLEVAQVLQLVHRQRHFLHLSFHPSKHLPKGISGLVLVEGVQLVPVEGEERLHLLVEVAEVVVLIWVFACDLFDHVAEGREAAVFSKDTFDLFE